MIGAVRDFRLADGSRIREQLLALSDVETSFAYCILEAPVPLRNYVADGSAAPGDQRPACLWQWRARFDPSGGRQARAFASSSRRIFSKRDFGRCERFCAGRSPASRCAAADPPPPSPRRGGAVEAAAIVIARYGGPEVLEPRTVRVAAPGPGEVRIRQTAIGVNFIDVYCRAGRFDLVSAACASLAWRRRASSRASAPASSSSEAGRPRRLCLRAARRLCRDAHDGCRAGLPPAGFSQRRGGRGDASQGHFRQFPAA